MAAVEAAGAVGFMRLPCDLDDLLALVRRTALPLSLAPPVPGPPRQPPARIDPGASRYPKLPVATQRVSGDAKARGAEAAEARRRRLLQRLARDVGELRPAVVKVRDELRALLAREQDGPLAPPEQRRLAALRREIEAQQLRLRECREEFERPTRCRGRVAVTVPGGRGNLGRAQPAAPASRASPDWPAASPGWSRRPPPWKRNSSPTWRSSTPPAPPSPLHRPAEESERGGPAGAPWSALADRVLPLSLKAPGAAREARRLAGLQRQEARLQREGDALAADARELSVQGHDLNHSARTGDPPVQVWRADVLAWAKELLIHQRRMARWGDALATHQRRRRQRREGI